MSEAEPERGGWLRHVATWIGTLAGIVVLVQVIGWLRAPDLPETAPGFALHDLDGKLVTLDDFAGRTVVLNFWATWCGPCRVEMPWLQKLHERYAEQGLVVLGLATDAAGRAPVERFLAERGITYPVAMADDAIVRDFGGIRGIPTTFIIDRAGVIRHRVVGIFAQPAMDAAVRRLLAEPAPADRPVVAS